MGDENNGKMYNETAINTGIGPGTVKSEYVRIEEVLSAIEEIRNKVNHSSIKVDDIKGNENLLKVLREEYKDFASAHPIVLRWMVEARQYDERAFKIYAKNHVKPSYKDRGEFWRCQAEYVILLFKRLNPRADIKTVRKYRESVLESLKKDDKEFTDANEAADKQVKEIKDRAIMARKDRIVKYLKYLKAQSAAPTSDTNADVTGPADSSV
jgi:hypothetical protein